VSNELEGNWKEKTQLLIKPISLHFPGEPGLFSSTVDVLAKIQTVCLSNTSVQQQQQQQQQHTWLVGFKAVSSSRLVRITRTLQLCQIIFKI
jgi:hypothetical protein